MDNKAPGTVESELGWWSAELSDIRAKSNDSNVRTVRIQRSDAGIGVDHEEQVPGNRIKVSSDLQWKSESKAVGQAL